MKTIEVLKKVSSEISTYALALMVLIVIVDVICRNVFNVSILIAIEMSGYLMTLVVLWGLVISFDNDDFVRVESVYQIFKGKVKRMVDIVFYFIIIVYSLILSWFIGVFTLSSYQLNSKSMTIIETPLYIPQAISLIGVLIFDLYLILKFIQFFTRKGE